MEDFNNKITPTPATPEDEINLIIPAPLPMNKIEDFEKKYIIGEMISEESEYLLYSGEEKNTKKNVIIKEYKQEFVDKMKDQITFFDIERNNYKDFNRKNFKYICKFIDCYQTD